MALPLPQITWRQEVLPGDPALIRALAADSGFFRPDEVAVAQELADTRLAQGLASGYHFLFAQAAEGVLGYACYGPIACTLGSWDLYWIVVRPDQQGRGLGAELLARAEARAAAAGGRSMYVETSSRPLYDPTRRFYEARGYRVLAVLSQFYAPDDDKVIYGKRLDPPAA
ncbi:MAG: GNAT family N-acetyltransferase [Desulfarculus sp.]|nr:MAG: GNAT family N-acetyltransferase [Desulfarculus sp.]